MKRTPQTLYEVLDDINKDTSKLGTFYKNLNRASPLAKVFADAFIPERRWALPEGEPPYKPSQYDAGATPVDLQIAIRRGRFDYFSPKMKIERKNRERIFIQLLEAVHEKEAKVLIAIKDQCLTEMFPNITYDVLAEYDYLPKRERVEQPKPEQKVATQPQADEGKGEEVEKPTPTPDDKSHPADDTRTPQGEKPVAKKPARRRGSSKAKPKAQTASDGSVVLEQKS